MNTSLFGFDTLSVYVDISNLSVGKLAYIAVHLGGGRGAEGWYTTGTPVTHLVVF